MKKLIFMLMILTIGFSCSDELTDLNIDTENPIDVPTAALIASAQVGLMDFVVDQNVNRNNFRLWSQMWAQTTYADESNYELVTRDVNGFAYERLYSVVLQDLSAAKASVVNIPLISDESIKANEAVITVMEVYTYSLLVDIFGDVPYTNALDSENLSPAYDDDKTIYYDLIEKLDSAIPNLTGSTMELGDVIYGGDITHWSKFANSLKLRMAIRIADSDNAKAEDMASEAVAAGVFTSTGDDFRIQYLDGTPHTHPLWVTLIQSGRSDYVASNTIADYMNALNDPRREYYFKDLDGGGNVVGGVYGATNAYTPNSKPGVIQEGKTRMGTALSYVEVEFLLADAAERGYISSSASGHYNAGITTSIVNWGVEGGASPSAMATAAATYLMQADVDYATAPGTWKEKIAMQKWLALYDQGFEAWSTYRVYDAPTMNIAAGVGTLPPSRYTYPFSEYTLNEENVKSAASGIGGDNLDSKVFWDVN